MQAILKLCLTTIVRGRIGIFWILLTFVLPFLLPQLSNHETNPEVLAPARIQAGWQVAWLISGLWLLFQAAKLGHEHTDSGMGMYFHSGGIDSSKQLTAIWLSLVICTTVLILAPIVVSLSALPQNESSTSHYIVLCVQQISLMLLVLLPLLLLAIGLGSRLGVVVGYLVSLGLLLFGFYGVTAIGRVVAVKDSFTLDLLYTVFPHFYLGDLTHRFVHMQGALTDQQCLLVFEYLAGWALLFAVVSWRVYTVRKK